LPTCPWLTIVVYAGGVVPLPSLIGGSVEPETLQVTAGVLVQNGSTLVRSFAGRLEQASVFAGLYQAGTLICTKP
jgi:hypothetical protein